MSRITLKKVAEEAGVSVQTASHILNTTNGKSYKPATRAKVEEIAHVLGYRPNAAARSMINQRSHIIGVIVQRLKGGWSAPMDVFEMMLGVNDVLAKSGYVTSIIPVSDLKMENAESRVFREQILDGLFVCNLPDVEEDLIKRIAPAYIWCDTNRDLPEKCIRRDEFQAGYMVCKELVSLGYRRIVQVTYAYCSGHYSMTDRFSGIRAAAAEAGVPLEIVGCTTQNMETESERVCKLLNTDTAVIAENYHFAMAVMQQAMADHIIPGADYGLAACDISSERHNLWPGLAGAVVDRTEIGVEAAQMMLELLDGEIPESVTIQPKWQPGDTVRAVSR